MEEAENLTHDDVLDIISKDFPIQPTGRKVIITINTNEVEGDELEESVNSLSETQYVMATGKNVMEIDPGQKVLLDLTKMMVQIPSRHNAMEENGQIRIDPIEVNGKIYTFVNETIIKAKDNR